MKCRSTVQEDGMTLHDVLEDIPYDGILAVTIFLALLTVLTIPRSMSLRMTKGL